MHDLTKSEMLPTLYLLQLMLIYGIAENALKNFGPARSRCD
jgi:hypothetical protein